jgi:hypothetical protein
MRANAASNYFPEFSPVMVGAISFDPARAMSTLEALHAIVNDEAAPQTIRDHVVDSLQFALRNYPGYFTTKEVQWLAEWNDTRIPIAATKVLAELKTA